MQTKKQLGTHAKITYCIQITKNESGLYEPRLVFLFMPEIILEYEDLLLIYGEFKTNPFAIMRDFSIGFIEGIKQNEPEKRVKEEN